MLPCPLQIIYGADGQPVRPDAKRGRGKGKSGGANVAVVNATAVAAGNGTPTTGPIADSVSRVALNGFRGMCHMPGNIFHVITLGHPHCLRRQMGIDYCLPHSSLHSSPPALHQLESSARIKPKATGNRQRATA
ncbi:hypothetical protein ACLKA6_011515 [Drosophila palustris]